jgi:hypothetical protein
MMANNANSKMSSDNRQRFMETNATNQKLLAGSPSVNRRL